MRDLLADCRFSLGADIVGGRAYAPRTFATRIATELGGTGWDQNDKVRREHPGIPGKLSLSGSSEDLLGRRDRNQNPVPHSGTQVHAGNQLQRSDPGLSNA